MMRDRKEMDPQLSLTEVRYHPDLPEVEATSNTCPIMPLCALHVSETFRINN